MSGARYRGEVEVKIKLEVEVDIEVEPVGEGRRRQIDVGAINQQKGWWSDSKHLNEGLDPNLMFISTISPFHYLCVSVPGVSIDFIRFLMII